MNRTRALEQLAESAAEELQEGAITPDRDLWPELVATLTRRRRERRARRIRRFGATTGILAGVLLIGSHMLSRSDQPASPRTTQHLQVALASQGTDHGAAASTSVPEIASLRAELAAVLAAEDLPASARTAIVEALAAIERERLALDQALAAAPESAQLARLRFEHDAREAELLHRLHRLTRSV